MNWKEIEKEYPKALRKCYDYFHEKYNKEDSGFKENFEIEYETCTDSGSCYRYIKLNQRELYDFFDDNEIYCNIRFNSKNSILDCYYNIYVFNKGSFQKQYTLCNDLSSSYDRKIIENIMFEHAFKILENQLKEANK